MESQKTITIYDMPTQPDEKSAILESHTMDDSIDFSRTMREETYIESSMPSILLKNIIYNCIPIEQAEDAPRNANDVSGGIYDPVSGGVFGGSIDSIGSKPTKIAKIKSKIGSATATLSRQSKMTDYVLHVQFPTAILVFVRNKGFTVRAAGDTIKMIGIMFDSSRSFIQAPYVFYVYRNTSIQNQALQGTLGLRSLVHRYKYPKIPRIANYYTHDLLWRDTSKICDGFPRKKITLRFDSDADALYKIRCVQQFLLGRELHYGLALGRTLRNLTSFVIPKLDFKSHQNQEITASRADSQLSAEQEIIMKILGIPRRFARDQNFATNVIYSTKFDELYLSLLNKTANLDDVTKWKQNISAIAKQQISAEIREIKLISEKSANAWRNAIARREFQKQLSELSSDELNVVTTTYDRESNHANALLSNKCAHNRLYRIVMSSRETSFDTQKWLKLRDLLDLPKGAPATIDELKNQLGSYETMIPCGRCKFAVLCPHNFIMFEYIDQLFGGDTSVCMRYILDTMTTKQNLADGSYCRLCGELLQRVSIESESWVNLAKSNEAEPVDPLALLIVDEVAETLNANLDLSRSAVNRSSLTQSIANSISPWVRRYELKLSRVKTNTELTIQFSLGLIIAIYTMMSLAHLIVLGSETKSTDIAIKTIKTGNETGLKLLHTLFNGIYKLLVVQRASVIEKIIAFTPDRIKKIMTRAYGKISGAPVTIESTVVKYHMDLVTDNPYFHFLRNLWRIGELLQSKNSRSVVPAKHGTVKSIIGVNVGEIPELRDFFEKTTLPDPWQPKTRAKGSSTSDIDPWLDYCWKVCSQFANRLINGTSSLDAVNTSEITAEYMANMKTRESLIMDTDTLDSAFSFDFRNLCRSRNFTSELTYLEPPVDLTRPFCTNGKVHNWKIYVLADADGNADKDYKSSEFKSLETPPGRFKTLRCTACGNTSCGSVRSSEANADDTGRSLSESISAFAKTRGLFAYYKIRCPKGSFHTFVDGKCEKCAFSASIAGEERTKYIAEYMSMYDARNKPVNAKYTSEVIENMRRDSGMVVPGKKPRMTWKPWVSQNGPISAAAAAWSQLPYNLLINISMMASSHFATIVSGKENPSNKASDAEWLNQANTAAGYVNNIVISFNKLITCTTRGMHPDLAEACEKQSDEVRALESIDLTNFYEEQMWRRVNDKPSSYANWAINKLCETLLEINGRSAPIAKRFADIMADAIAESELNMSKSVVYKNIMIAASKSALGLDAAGDEIEAPETDVEAKDFIKSIVDEGENFGTGDVDIDDVAASRGDDDI